MDAALERCYRAVPPTSLREMAHPQHAVALRCTRGACSACADFAMDGQKAYELRMRRRHPNLVIRPWNCDVPAFRRLARSVGVTDLPAYVVLSPDGRTEVRRAI